MTRRYRLASAMLLAISTVAAGPAVADDLAGAQSYLCAARAVHACQNSAACRAIDPAELNIPDFVLVDLAAKQLRTTAASGENRASAILQVVREDGLVFLQGVEQGRAWSFLIVEETGELTASVARENLSVSVFGVCTPAPAGRP